MSNPPSAPALVPSQPVGQPAPEETRQESKVPPPAAKAKPQRRHFGLVLSFFICWLVPVMLVAGYMWLRAADQYASHLGFSVRTEEASSAIELLGGITDLSSGSSSDTDILNDFLTSQELVREIDQAVDLRAIWSRVPTSRDPVFAFDAPGTIEDLVDHWERKVTIIYDSGAGLIDMRVLAFDPQDARDIAQAVLEESTQMINQLSAIAREDAIGYAEAELEVAVDRLKTARTALTEFRNRTQIVDPTIDTQNQMGLLVNLQQQLAESLIDLDLLQSTTQSNDPRITQAERRVEVIESRIEAERRKLGLGSSGEGGEVFANLVGEYESLIVDREFAEAAYTSALAAYDSARAEAQRQSRYLAPHVRPTLAESAQFPERMNIMLLSALFLLFGWAIGVLIYYSLRDRR
ncbi:hypothetical protein FIU86_17815 [Roseovarius sp. THAF9]|uniref:capsule biosynthesis protein n=1 Tax=Roseovarius sp. THAF9 TaxID=2587847 RepID=UPI001268D52B|nr:capsule biosynthesis protein [Roseovarius sp. THAF9]QFT94713.1 hypothetical protein FIU86_17815 [Roseovarius sp. THAF9]